MGVQVNLKDIQSGFLSASLFTENNTLIEQALNKALDRTASTDNAMEVDLDMGTNKIFNVTTDVSDSTSLLSVADGDARYLNTTGDTLAGDLNAGGFIITNSGVPSAPNDLARLVDVGPDSSAQLRAELSTSASTEGSDLVAHTGTSDTVTEALDKRTVFVGSVAELEALSLPAGTSVRLTNDGVAGAGVVKAGSPPADPLKGKYVVIANGNYWERDTNGFLFPQFFGSGGADDQAAIEACRDLCDITGDAMGLYGTYSYATAPDLAIQNLNIYPIGEVLFKHTGNGPMFLMDGAKGTPPYTFGVQMSGPIIVEGNANSSSALVRSLVQSRIDLEVREMLGTAFDVQFGVLNKYYLACTINRKDMVLVPTKGIVVDAIAGEPGLFNSANEFYLIMEGINGLGVDLIHAKHNRFYGTSEGNNGGGVRDSALCEGNNWDNFYCEKNAGIDVDLAGKRNHFTNLTSLSFESAVNNVELSTAENTTFEGGSIRTVNCQSTSKNSTFIGVATSDNAALGIKGIGSKRLINCSEYDPNGVTTGQLQDVLSDTSIWSPTIEGSPTAGAATYTVQSGKYSVVGDQMTFNIDLTIDTLGGAAGTAIIPLPAGYVGNGDGNQSLMVAEISGVTLSGTGIYLAARLSAGQTAFTLISVDPAGANAAQSVSGFSSGDQIRLCGTIIVAKV